MLYMSIIMNFSSKIGNLIENLMIGQCSLLLIFDRIIGMSNPQQNR